MYISFIPKDCGKRCISCVFYLRIENYHIKKLDGNLLKIIVETSSFYMNCSIALEWQTLLIYKVDLYDIEINSLDFIRM